MDDILKSKGPDELYCAHCGAVIRKDDSFCLKCGARNREAPDNPAPADTPTAMPVNKPTPVAPIGLSGARRDYSTTEPVQSGLGVTSFIISLVTVALFAVMYIVALNQASNGYISDGFYSMMGLAIISIIISLITGIILGIIGLTQPWRKKALTIIGLTLNSIWLLGIITLEMIGSTA
jgi:hypothetical protein